VKAPLTVISSMATRELLSDLCSAFQRANGIETRSESVGGVDAAKRIAAGEAFDVAVLAADAIDKLIASGQLERASKIEFVRSAVAIAVKAGARRPDLSTTDTLKAALRSAASIGYSTGPSGNALLKLFEAWGLAKELAPRLVQAPSGVPVGTLIAQGRVEIGFQQYSELFTMAGIDVVGEMPKDCAIITTFSAARCKASQAPDAAARLLAFFGATENADNKRRHGMMPA